MSLTVLAADVCNNRVVCSEPRQFSDTVNYSAFNPYNFDLNEFLSRQLESPVTVNSAESNCVGFELNGGNSTFIPSMSCQIWVKEIRHTPGRSPDINGDGIVDDGDLLQVLFNFGQSCSNSDIDQNGGIDDADLLTVLFNFGNQGNCILGDINRDGVVDDADLLEVLFHFGSVSACVTDINEDGVTDDGDLLLVLFCFGTDGEGCRAKRTEECDITINIIPEVPQSSGQTGGQGSQGQQTGTTGQSTGSAGDQGSTGSVGSEGSAGGQGATGSQGESGQTGSTGSNDDEVGVTCTETNFRQNIRTMDHNSRSVQRAAGAVLSYMNTTGPARRSRALRTDIINAQARIHNLFVANWTKMWESLPTTITQCTTNSDQVTCTTTSFSDVYSSILRNETRIIQTVQSLINKHSSLYRNRAREAREIQRLLNRAKRAGALSANFIASLPSTSTVCSSL